MEAEYKAEISRLNEIIQSQHGNAMSMAETNRVMGERLVKYETSLKQIAQMTGNGDYLNDMLEMKTIATNALKLSEYNKPI